MSTAILAISTAVPSNTYSQEELAQKAEEIFCLKTEKADLMRRIYGNSAIRKRHSVINDFNLPRKDWQFWGSAFPYTTPGMSPRNRYYKEEAPKLAEQAARTALEKWGGDASSISHIISVSCTGVMAPGIEFHLMQNLGLSPYINRLGINFMGCFGAFKGLSVARAFAKENERHRILLVCTELCSLHLQGSDDSSSITGHSLFADGAAAALIGAYPNNSEYPLWEIIRTLSLGFPDTIEKMTWEAGDNGFLMQLSPTVPVHIGRQIKGFAKSLLKKDASVEECDWAIHPGGKSIIQVIERALGLMPDQTQASWEILRDFGNLSSASFLFVLDILSRQATRRAWTAGLGFGPGLSTEGILLHSPK